MPAVELEDGETAWFRYVLHRNRPFYEKQGWVFAADLGHHHGFYCILMQAPKGWEPNAYKEIGWKAESAHPD